MRFKFTILICSLFVSAALAAPVPQRLNYQGVLRDSSGLPVDATHNVVFSLYALAAGGDALLIDEHLIAGTGGITFSNGLFNAEIGGGNVFDGPWPGTFLSLSDVFENYTDVFLEIEVNNETLSPRVPIAAAAYAVHAGNAETADSAITSGSLGSLTPNDVITTSIAPQTKSGGLTVNGELTFGSDLVASNGAAVLHDPNSMIIRAGDDSTDDLYLQGGDGPGHGNITVEGEGAIRLNSGNGLVQFTDGSGQEMATLSSPGYLDLTGGINLGDQITTDGGGRVSFSPDILRIQAGVDDTDDVWLVAGNDNTDGRIEIRGDSTLSMWAGNGQFTFWNAATGAQTASLSSSGTLQIDGDFEVDGDLRLDFGGALTASSISTTLKAGDSNLDDLRLHAGDTADDGLITLFGDGAIRMEAGNGEYQFYSAGIERASLNSSGDLQLDGEITLLSGTRFYSTPTGGFLSGGPGTSSDLTLRANTLSETYGVIEIFGSGSIDLEPGNGILRILDNGAPRLFTDATGNLDIAGRLDMDGGAIYMRESGVDGNQTMHFREDGLSSGERFEWDNAADRFEVSDDFHAFGTITASVKNFVQNHPYRDDLEVVYTSLEGDEATAFTRGFGRLVDGEARIRLGETFAYVTNPDLGLSAHLTPRGRWAELYVAELTPEEIVVRAAPGTPDLAFDFIVFGLRIGHEELPVLRPRRSESFLPTAEEYRGVVAGDPSLAEATALARYTKMAEQVPERAAVDTSKGDALKAAIGQAETQFDWSVGATAPRRAAENVAGGDPDAYALTENQVDPDTPAPSQPQPQTQPRPAAQDGPIERELLTVTADELATMLPAGQSLDPGDLVVIDPQSGAMIRSTLAGDRGVVGVIADNAGFVLGSGKEGDVPVATSGVVLANVDASFGAILPGDLLVTAETPGHARRADDPAPGTILGKALERLDVGTGKIRVLVTLR